MASWQNGKSKKWLILVDNKSKLKKWLADKIASWSNGIGTISHHPMEQYISQLPFIIEGTTEKVMEIHYIKWNKLLKLDIFIIIQYF
jgi:hypothetical protein